MNCGFLAEGRVMSEIRGVNFLATFDRISSFREFIFWATEGAATGFEMPFLTTVAKLST